MRYTREGHSTCSSSWPWCYRSVETAYRPGLFRATSPHFSNDSVDSALRYIDEAQTYTRLRLFSCDTKTAQGGDYLHATVYQSVTFLIADAIQQLYRLQVFFSAVDNLPHSTSLLISRCWMLGRTIDGRKAVDLYRMYSVTTHKLLLTNILI